MQTYGGRREYEFNFYEVRQRIKYLEKRYWVFHDLIKHEGVYWERSTNTIFTLLETWASLIKKQ
ncbi:hypothetical protein ACS0TY_034090 [Phlomoides rotata]